MSMTSSLCGGCSQRVVGVFLSAGEVLGRLRSILALSSVLDASYEMQVAFVLP